ncbi:MAG: hypothetical protein H7Y88_12300 [Phycisphaerales bacterium]|nr:hypothetical protein [Phycisphaerales bacterium]
MHTKPRQEKALASDLSALRIAHFLPLVKAVRYYGRRKCAVELPLFPGYLFLRGGAEDTYTADRTDRVAGILKVADQARLDEELSGIRRAIELDGRIEPYDGLVSGTEVEVTSGPFRGIRGIVDQAVPRDRLILRVSLLGKAASLEIDRSLLLTTT